MSQPVDFSDVVDLEGVALFDEIEIPCGTGKSRFFAGFFRRNHGENGFVENSHCSKYDDDSTKESNSSSDGNPCLNYDSSLGDESEEHCFDHSSCNESIQSVENNIGNRWNDSSESYSDSTSTTCSSGSSKRAPPLSAFCSWKFKGQGCKVNGNPIDASTDITEILQDLDSVLEVCSVESGRSVLRQMVNDLLSEIHRLNCQIDTINKGDRIQPSVQNPAEDYHHHYHNQKQ
jgi:hypothetical protein